MSLNNIAFYIILFITVSCDKNQNLEIDFSDPNISYSGRIDTSNNLSTDIYWSGSSIKLNFEGEKIEAVLKEGQEKNYYNIIIDNNTPSLLVTDTIKQSYLLASNLSKGKHSVEIFRRTEWSKGKTSFYGFKISGNAKTLPKSAPKKRKIEFYGNSITAGYAVEDYVGDSPDSIYTNNYESYAAVTARYFDSEYRAICKGGIGITISWFPLTMPEMYNRLIPEDPESKWDFSLYTPDITVINLFQNDSWLVDRPKHAQFKSKFGTTAPDENFIISSYENFVKKIRTEYPNTEIICMLGNMDATKENSKWPIYIQKAVDNLNDSKMHTLFVPYKNTPGHPKVKEQKIMANKLIQYIDKNIQW